MDAEVRATELFNTVMKQVTEARNSLAKKMLERGMTPDKYYIEDNFSELAEGGTMEYICTPKLRKEKAND